MEEESQAGRRHPTWTFLTHHTHVLMLLHENPDLRLRECAAHIGITERAVQNIVSDLEEVGALSRVREGRRNHYCIHHDRPLPNPIESKCVVGDLLVMSLAHLDQLPPSPVPAPEDRP
ncbi:MAG: AsnC family transcriptional regulator [Verrucomicrobia bacterium]|nr:AsnC family transcriptional regulator [Verrucomicrobiota bacterium]